MKHLVLVGACYLDTILSIPHFPEEDSKLRATSLQVRRGGNCPNSLEVLQQLLANDENDAFADATGGENNAEPVQAHLVSPLPARESAATAQILSSFSQTSLPQRGEGDSVVDFEHCIYREGHTAPASSYILRSQVSGSRTIVNHNDLPEMTVEDFAESLTQAAGDGRGSGGRSTWWFHFEGRIPDTTLDCIRFLRRELPAKAGACDVRVSVEVEKPGRQGLRELAQEADVVFYSKSWAEANGYASAEACLKGEELPRANLAFCTWGQHGAACLSTNDGTCLHCRISKGDVPVVDTIGAGDTFIAGILYGLTRRAGQWDTQRTLRFATDLATLKVQREGFGGLAGDVATGLKD